MSRRHYWLPLALLVAAPMLLFTSGCGKYETLERNMQYVSKDLLHRDAQSSWNALQEAHARWIAAGSSHDNNDVAYGNYKDAYERYAVIYNELVDRQGGSFIARLHGPSDELPPPPPGVAATPRPAPVVPPVSSEPVGKDLGAGAPASGVAAPAAMPQAPAVSPQPATATPAPAVPAPATTTSAGGERYVIKSGDTLRAIAKRHGVTEKKLLEANGLTDPDKIAAGKTLVIPAR